MPVYIDPDKLKNISKGMSDAQFRAYITSLTRHPEGVSTDGVAVTIGGGGGR